MLQNKLFITSFLFMLSLSFLPISIYAGSANLLDSAKEKVTQFQGQNGNQTGLQNLIAQIINTVLGIVGLVILILIIYAGIMWLTAGGNQEKVGKAKKILVNSIIGAIVIFSAYAITWFIVNSIT